MQPWFLWRNVYHFETLKELIEHWLQEGYEVETHVSLTVWRRTTKRSTILTKQYFPCLRDSLGLVRTKRHSCEYAHIWISITDVSMLWLSFCLWMLFLSPLVDCVIVSFRVFLTSSQSTRRASEAPSPQEGKAPGRAPGCLRATTGTVNTAIESVATTAGQWRKPLRRTHASNSPPKKSASFY